MTIILLLILLLVLAVAIGLFSNFLGLILYLLVAAIVGWLAELIVPGPKLFGGLGAIIAGLVGSWLGSVLFGNFGPSLAGVHLIPAFIGAVIFAVAVTLIARLFVAPRRRY